FAAQRPPLGDDLGYCANPARPGGARPLLPQRVGDDAARRGEFLRRALRLAPLTASQRRPRRFPEDSLSFREPAVLLGVLGAVLRADPERSSLQPTPLLAGGQTNCVAKSRILSAQTRRKKCGNGFF